MSLHRLLSFLALFEEYKAGYDAVDGRDNKDEGLLKDSVSDLLVKA
jgi:hypothetical protein